MQWDSLTQMHVVPVYVNTKFNLTDPLHQDTATSNSLIPTNGN